MNHEALRREAASQVDQELRAENADLRVRLKETEMKLEQMKYGFRAMYEIAFNDASPVGH